MPAALSNFLNFLKSQLVSEKTCPNYCVKTYRRIIDQNSQKPYWIEYNTKSPFVKLDKTVKN